MNLNWSESAWWRLSSGLCKTPGALFMSMGMPVWARFANDHYFAHLQPSTAQGSLFMPMCTTMRPWWANDHDVAHLQTKTVPMNLIWSESVQWLLSSGICNVNFQETSLCPWAHLCGPDKQMTMVLFICTTVQNDSKEFDLEWIGPVVAEFPGVCKVPRAFIMPVDTPMWPQWTNDHGVAHPQVKTVPINFIWSESVQ